MAWFTDHACGGRYGLHQDCPVHTLRSKIEAKLSVFQSFFGPKQNEAKLGDDEAKQNRSKKSDGMKRRDEKGAIG